MDMSPSTPLPTTLNELAAMVRTFNARIVVSEQETPPLPGRGLSSRGLRLSLETQELLLVASGSKWRVFKTDGQPLGRPCITVNHLTSKIAQGLGCVVVLNVPVA